MNESEIKVRVKTRHLPEHLPSDSPQFSFFENDVVYDLDYEYMFHFILGIDGEEHTPVIKRLLELGLEDINIKYKYIDCKLIEPRGE